MILKLQFGAFLLLIHSQGWFFFFFIDVGASEENAYL